MAEDWTRRRFVATTLVAGFAAAVRPIAAATTVTTDTEGLVAGEVQIPAEGVELPGYRAMPSGSGPFPAIVVVEEIFGVHEHIRDVCRRFAKRGCLAVAPELFARRGDPGKLDDPQRIVSEIVSKTPDAQVMADLDATAAWATRAPEKGDAARLGVTGFCWGGRIVWLWAAHAAKLRAGVAWYGRLTGATTPLQPKHPLDVAAALEAPVLGLYGGADAGIPPADVEKMRAALKAAGKPSEIVVYPGAPHGFHADYRPSYRADAARDGFARALAWFAKHGVA